MSGGGAPMLVSFDMNFAKTTLMPNAWQCADIAIGTSGAKSVKITLGGICNRWPLHWLAARGLNPPGGIARPSNEQTPLGRTRQILSRDLRARMSRRRTLPSFAKSERRSRFHRERLRCQTRGCVNTAPAVTATSVRLARCAIGHDHHHQLRHLRRHPTRQLRRPL